MTMEINSGEEGASSVRQDEGLSCDIAIVGGGLAGGLAALALAQARPQWDIRLIEAGTIGGNHLWSFFSGDISESAMALLEPLIGHRWQNYDVRFPAYQRHVDMAYQSITGESLAAQVAAVLPEGAVIKGEAERVTPLAVDLADGRRVQARYVLDARGFDGLEHLDAGWQKFVGQALTIKGGHGLTSPIVMDVTVPQIDGYRFVYCLPFDAETVFVEDTYYSDGAALDIVAVQARILDYAAQQGWQVSEISRTETGVLPVVMAGDFDAIWPEQDRLARLGVRAGGFHATTGYSLPFAVETALALPDILDGEDAAGVLRSRARAHWRRQAYYRLLSTMLFKAAQPESRYPIFQRFYRLSPNLIARFYAGHNHMGDKLRILSGKPPVPVGRAISAIKDLRWI